MSNFNFKVGDKIYYPKISNEILTVQERYHNKYPLFVELGYQMYSFTIDGKHITDDSNLSVFPATQEWYDKLVQVYPDLEKPPVKKTPKEIILAMIEDDWAYIPCKVDNHEGTFNYADLINCIVGVKNCSFVGVSEWKYAKPFDPRTGKDIIDYVDGKVVLEGWACINI